MAMSLMIENINNDFSVYGSKKADLSARSGNYYKFYQTKLRQLVTQRRYRKEQEARLVRQKTKNSFQDNRLAETRLHKEPINYIRERSKVSTQENFPNKFEDQRKPMDSTISNSSRTSPLSIISTTLETRPKSIMKPKTVLMPVKQQRVISAPFAAKSYINKSKISVTIKNDPMEDNLSKANIHSFTQVSSSSSNSNGKARQSILDTIYSHLNSHHPTDVSLWPMFEDIDNKFSSSIAPSVYLNFQRNTA